MRLPWHRPTPPPAAELTGWFKPQAPAASTPRVPGPNPGAGAPAPAEAVPPRPASPGTGHHAALNHDCGPVVKRISIHEGGCVFMWSNSTGKWEHIYHCGRQDFDVAEWERKLTP